MFWPQHPNKGVYATLCLQALSYFDTVATAINLTNLMEPDFNYHPPRHDLGWFAAQVRCNCTWTDSCCQTQTCCSSTPSPSPPVPAPPGPHPSGLITVSTKAPPTIIHAQKYAVTPTGDAKFAKTLYRFPDGQLFTNFHTSCDVCKMHSAFPGRSFYSADNGASWTEIATIANGGQAWSNCIASDDGSNALTCFAIPISITDPHDNRTSGMLTARFEIDKVHGVQQTVRTVAFDADAI